MLIIFIIIFLTSGMGSNVLRRSGSYDTVPSPRSKESLQVNFIVII